MEPRLLLDKPVPLWWVDPGPEGIRARESDLPLFELTIDLGIAGCAFRAVGVDRLRSVLENGIDVVPTDAPIYVDDISKAWEYGGIPEVDPV